MSNITLPEGEKKKLWNGYLHPDTIERMKEICRRTAVRAGKKRHSEAVFIGELIAAAKMPPKPTVEQEKAHAKLLTE
jgi:hypothetical protein